MNSITQAGASDTYQKAQEALINAYLADPNKRAMSQEQIAAAVAQAVLTPSYLRFEVQLSTTNNQYYFPVKVNEPNSQGQAARPTEVRLHDQDAFYATGMMLYISKLTTNGNTAPYPTNMMLDTYPNAITYPLAFAAGTPPGASTIETLYNGKLTLNVNERTLLTALPLSDFRQVPQTQLTGATNSPISQFDGTGLQFIEPNLVFIGTKKNILNIVLPSTIATLEATPVMCVLKFWGVLAQNITLFS